MTLLQWSCAGLCIASAKRNASAVDAIDAWAEVFPWHLATWLPIRGAGCWQHFLLPCQELHELTIRITYLSPYQVDHLGEAHLWYLFLDHITHFQVIQTSWSLCFHNDPTCVHSIRHPKTTSDWDFTIWNWGSHILTCCTVRCARVVECVRAYAKVCLLYHVTRHVAST